MGDNIRFPKLIYSVIIMVVASRSEENQYISLPITKNFDGLNDQKKIQPSPDHRCSVQPSSKTG
ncbi:hypothetical protein P0D72_34055 [Paraburkholderia sediminicola]|uniref:hypothetical protein n=1 Tax=Paraburkholderia sediminicola TaxID=458836 RepID=UPI0038BC42DA